jgi:2-hydroxycyclohexanecarboxyl-CoA dehydrogenase
VDQFLKSVPVGRFGEPEDIGNAVAWLASEESSYITGQTIGVNGGRYLT